MPAGMRTRGRRGVASVRAAAGAGLTSCRSAAAVLTALVVAGGLVVTGADPAGAHATLLGTAPAADSAVDAVPDQVELRFDEPVEVIDDAVRVFGPGGDRVDLGTVESRDGGATLAAPIDTGDAPGTYTVAWRVTSQDSHTLTGSFVFHHQTRTGAVDIGADRVDTVTSAVGGLGRWLAYAGALAVVGACTLALLRRRPPGGDGADRRLRLLALGGAAGGAVGAVLALVATVAESTGRSLGAAAGLVPDVAPDTRTGQLALARVACLVVTAGVAAVAAAWRRTPATVLVPALAALVATALAGHAWTTPARGVALAADIAHLVTVGAWAGGVLALLVVLPAEADADGRVRTASRFSRLALAAVVVVVATGAVSGWLQVRGLDALLSTGYGQLLLAKVVAVGGMVWLGWLNREQFIGMIDRTVRPLTRSLQGEVALAALVLALTAALVHQPPARTTVVTGPVEESATAESGEVVNAVVDPGTVGANDIHLYFYAADGTAPLPVDAVQVAVSTADVPARRLQVTPISPEHVTVPGASLPSPGTWTVEVTAVQSGEPLAFTFEVPIA